MLPVICLVAGLALLVLALCLRGIVKGVFRPIWYDDLDSSHDWDLRWMETSLVWRRVNDVRPYVVGGSGLITFCSAVWVALCCYVSVPMGHEGIIGGTADDQVRVLAPGATYRKWPWEHYMLIDRSDHVGVVSAMRGFFETNNVHYTYRVPASLMPATELRKSRRDAAQTEELVQNALRNLATAALGEMADGTTKTDRAKRLTAILMERGAGVLRDSGIELVTISCN